MAIVSRKWRRWRSAPWTLLSATRRPPYGLEFMGKEWDRLLPPDRRNCEWDGRRRNDSAAKWEPSVRDRGDGRPGGPQFSTAAHYKPNTKCKACGLWQFDKNPCRCASPQWEYRVREEAPTQAVAMQEWHRLWAREALRVLKPGGHLLAFGGTRTYHRLACAIEDAGFEIRDCLSWMYGSGFPKSLDVSKAIDAKAGAEREVVGHNPKWNSAPRAMNPNGGERQAMPAYTAPATPEAQQWQGWGTALKPAHEPIVLARKPLAGTVAQNVLTNGCGALNINGTMVENGGDELARWPANVTVDEIVAGTLPPWFYVAKASSAERNAGLDGFEAIHRVNGNKWTDQDYRVARGERPPSAESGPRKNVHPTVKPIELMRWLVRLVTPPGGRVLDPFAGSGTTGCAAVLEGFEFVGIEREEEYVRIAEARIAWWSKHPDGLELVKGLEAERVRKRMADTGQLGLEIG